jgi:hypothetical protein
MVEYFMKKEICGTFHAKCGTRDLTYVFGTVSRKAGRVVTLSESDQVFCQFTHVICTSVYRTRLLRVHCTVFQSYYLIALTI